MEAFESVVALALETEGFVVSEPVKFPVLGRTSKRAFDEFQTHGNEVDLVAARSDLLVLATVKSFFGSSGVTATHVTGTHEKHRSKYKILNNKEAQRQVIDGACKRYGYKRSQVRLRLYAGRFAGPSLGLQEAQIRAWAAKQKAGGGPIEVFNVSDVMDRVVKVAASTEYRNNPVLATIKALAATGYLVDPEAQLAGH